MKRSAEKEGSSKARCKGGVQRVGLLVTGSHFYFGNMTWI